MENQFVTAAEPLLPNGTILDGTYQIVRPLADGGCGEVYAAAHTRLPGEFAVKVLHRALLRDEEAQSRFRREAEITAGLRHPHIVQVFDFNVTAQGIPYLAMELLEGDLLTKRLMERGAAEPVAAVRIVEQIANALHAAHQQGIVHRDLKPDNVILLSVDGRDDFVKLVDFGISQASWRPRVTGTGRIVGTPQFMSPEQARGLREEIDARTDQFSLAAIAYTLLTGHEPFWSDDLTAVLYQVVHEMPAPPSHRAPGVGPEVDGVIARGLAKSPADRYPDIVAFAAALRDAIVEPDRPQPRWEPIAITSAATAPRVHAPAPTPVTVDNPTVNLTRNFAPRSWARGGAALLVMLALATTGMMFSPRARAGAQVSWVGAQAQVSRLVDQASRTTASILRTAGVAAADLPQVLSRSAAPASIP